MSGGRLESLKIKAKLLQKAKAKAGQPIALKDAFATLARLAGYGSWRAMNQAVAAAELLRPAKASAYWSVWYATHAEALAHVQAHGGYLLPFERQFFVCDAHYLVGLGLAPEAADVVAIGADWSQPLDRQAYTRVLSKLAGAK